MAASRPSATLDGPCISLSGTSLRTCQFRSSEIITPLLSRMNQYSCHTARISNYPSHLSTRRLQCHGDRPCGSVWYCSASSVTVQVEERNPEWVCVCSEIMSCPCNNCWLEWCWSVAPHPFQLIIELCKPWHKTAVVIWNSWMLFVTTTRDRRINLINI
jgi:hypothetical protein